MTVRRRFLLYLLISILYSVNAFAREPQPPSNQEIISQIFTPPVLRILTDSLKIKESIAIKSSEPEAFASWVAQILTDSCLSKNFLVYSPPDSGVISVYTITVSNPWVEITYQSAGRRWLLFKKGFRRTIEGGYHLQITDGEQRVLLGRQISGMVQDVIPEKMIERVESNNLPFSKGTKLKPAFITRWLEPIVITAATMTVVYLFYTIRSEK